MDAWIAEAEIGADSYHLKAVTRVLEAIRMQPDQPLTLQQMSRIAFISRHHFIRIFRRQVGIPPMRYQWVMRLAHAKRLLVETEMSVIEVCFEAGYNSLGTFTRRFTSLVGIPPHHFRLAARSFDRKRLSELISCLDQDVGPLPPARIAGEIHAPAGFDGFVLIGLFPAGDVHALPRACCALTHPGRFEFGSVADGAYVLKAAAIPRFGPILDYFVHDQALRAAAAGPLVVHDGLVSGTTSLELRHPKVTDLPILAGLVPLLEARFSYDRRFNLALFAARAATTGFGSISAAGGM